MSDDHGDDGSGEERRAGINHAQPRFAAEQERQGQGPSIVVVRASEIEPERVGWIWPGIIARGKVTGLVGHPGLGKSQVATDAAATVSTGRPWPGDVTNDGAGDVIILSAEDDPADTGVPRLIAARADRTRIHFLKAVKENSGGERRFSLALDLDRLEKEIDLRQVTLVVIDPASAYLIPKKGKGIDRNNAGDVRTILDRLGAFAARHDLGVLAISHLNKSSGARAITRIMGSQEWAAAPRAVFIVTEDAGTGRRLFLPLKNNLAPDRFGYSFEIEDKIIAEGINTSAVVWGSEPVTISADEALAAAAMKKDTSRAVEFLEEVLSEGPMDQTDIVRLGKEAGFTEKNLRTAREKLGVTPRKEGFGANGKWVWMPAGDATVLRLVVNNEAKNGISPAHEKASEGSNEGDNHSGRDADQPEEHESDPVGPDGDGVA
jgi:putative DNA primase/helicase